MKEFLLDLIRSSPNPIQSQNLVIEYLQTRILESLQCSGALIPLAFYGGTALRFLFGIARFSEDLDFTLEHPLENYDFRTCLKAIRSDLTAEGYNVQIKVNDRKRVYAAFVRFYGLRKELNLTPLPEEAISVRIEIDTYPPQGTGLETDLVYRYIPLRLQHHDRASLLSGKLHAILTRDYAKGGDLYDLMWYLSDPDWPEPNLVFLRNALIQNDWAGLLPDVESWRGMIYARLKSLNWKAALADVHPFLERPEEINLLTIENLGRLLHQTDKYDRFP